MSFARCLLDEAVCIVVLDKINLKKSVLGYKNE